MKTVAYIPIKTNNERLPGKNTLRFHDGTPLINFIQQALLCTGGVDNIYIYSSDVNMKDYCLEGVDFIARPEYLDLSTATPKDIMNEFISKIDADIYITAHATSPFIDPRHISDGLNAVKYGGYDSAFTAAKLQKLIWKDVNEPLNFNPNQIPRTQDLSPLYAEVSAAYIYKKEVFEKLGRRIGENPKIINVDDIEAIDIDYPIDFKIADAIYKDIIMPARGQINE